MMQTNNYDKSYISKMFSNTPNYEFDLHEMMDTCFRSIDTSEVGRGNEVMSVTRNLARYLLHNLKHEAPNEKQVNKILRLKAHYDFHGVGKSWSGSPIVINNKTREIEDGVTRLYAISLGKSYGHYMPMKLNEGE